MTHERFTYFIKAVGTGPKHNHDLTAQEMKEVMTAILLREVSDTQIGGYMLGWRVKGETIEELEGALSAFENLLIKQNLPHTIELGYPYDGKVDNPYLLPLMASYLEESGIAFTICRDVLQPAKEGLSLDILFSNVDKPKNLHVFDRQCVFPSLYGLSKLRNELGIRTTFNTIEKLTGFANSKIAVVGAFHKPFVDKYIKLYAPRYKKLVIVKGNEGTPEVFSKCKIWICKEEHVEEMTIDPGVVGINYLKSWQPISHEESLQAIKKPSEALLALAKFNAAMMLFIHSSDYASVYEAYESL